MYIINRLSKYMGVEEVFEGFSSDMGKRLGK